jgi:transcriptional regulator GlxA family with amidase domain
MGIRFRPGSVTRWFDIDMKRTADREAPLERLIGRAETRALTARLAAAPTGGQLAKLAAAWLDARPVRSGVPGDSVARAGVRLLIASRGRTRIAALAAALAVTTRRLERGFARNVGLRPKLFARIVRLHAALALLAAEERVDAVDWALASGYFDQAHLARDFRVVAGRRARAGGNEDGQLARHFTAPERLLAFLASE